jgi:hypothetical protein
MHQVRRLLGAQQRLSKLHVLAVHSHGLAPAASAFHFHIQLGLGFELGLHELV